MRDTGRQDDPRGRLLLTVLGGLACVARLPRAEPVCPGIALEDDDLPIVIGCDSKVPGVATQPCILEFFDLARVEKFKRHWARGERLQGSHELARRRYRKVSQ